MAKRKRQWSLTRELRFLKEWLPAKRDFLIDHQRRRIEDELKAPTKYSRVSISTSFGCMASWIGGQAVVQVAAADAEGWRLVQGSYAYWHWEQRILEGLRRHGAMTRSDRLRVSLVLGHALAIGDQEVASWAGDTIVESLDEPEIMNPAWDLVGALPPLMVRVYALHRQLPIDFAQYDHGKLYAYQKVLDAWEDPRALEGALVEACDYHVNRCRGEALGLEFAYNPYAVFPAEILAIYRVRGDLGLETPALEHPLLESPLARPPETMPEYHDELLERVLKQLRAEMPDI